MGDGAASGSSSSFTYGSYSANRTLEIGNFDGASLPLNGALYDLFIYPDDIPDETCRKLSTPEYYYPFFLEPEPLLFQPAQAVIGGVTGKSNPLSGPLGGPLAGPLG